MINNAEKFLLVCNQYIGTSAVETNDVYTIVIKSPNHGICKSSLDCTTYAFDKSNWISNEIDISDLMERILKQSNYEVGDYIYQVYIDGYLVAQSDFLIY